MDCSIVTLGVGMPSWGEFLILFAIVVLLFGPSKLPKLAKALRLSLAELRKGRNS